MPQLQVTASWSGCLLRLVHGRRQHCRWESFLGIQSHCGKSSGIGQGHCTKQMPVHFLAVVVVQPRGAEDLVRPFFWDPTSHV
eukprot:6209035-Pleurochrysis_carterae.AAC.1